MLSSQGKMRTVGQCEALLSLSESAVCKADLPGAAGRRTGVAVGWVVGAPSAGSTVPAVQNQGGMHGRWERRF